MAAQFSSLFFLSKEIDLHGQNWSNEADSVQIPIIFSPTFWMPWMWRRVRLIPDAKVPDMHRSVAGIPVWWLNEKNQADWDSGSVASGPLFSALRLVNPSCMWLLSREKKKIDWGCGEAATSRTWNDFLGEQKSLRVWQRGTSLLSARPCCRPAEIVSR